MQIFLPGLAQSNDFFWSRLKRAPKPGHLLCLQAALFALLLFSFTGPAFAACADPSGTTGEIVYASSSHAMVYCDGYDWVGVGK